MAFFTVEFLLRLVASPDTIGLRAFLTQARHANAWVSNARRTPACVRGHGQRGLSPWSDVVALVSLLSWRGARFVAVCKLD